MSYWCLWQIATDLLLLILQKTIFESFFQLMPMLDFELKVVRPHGRLDIHLYYLNYHAILMLVANYDCLANAGSLSEDCKASRH